MGVKFTLHVELSKADKARAIRKASREQHGRPGQGRKTTHVDQKKRANKKACRGRVDGDDT